MKKKKQKLKKKKKKKKEEEEEEYWKHELTAQTTEVEKGTRHTCTSIS